jgi:hypothetical protein
MGRSGEEDDMNDTTPALDEALERMAAASFELPNGFVNHGAMACEALAMLDCTGDIDSWARRFARAGGASVDPVVPASSWYRALPNSTTMSPATAGKAGCPISRATNSACSASQCASPSATRGALANAANTPGTASTGHGSIGPDVTVANSSVIPLHSHRARYPGQSPPAAAARGHRQSR